MRLGGNSRARAALQEVLEEADLKSRYESPQAELHRTNLKADVYKSLGLPLEEPPTESRNRPIASADPRFRGATAISSDQFHRHNGPPRHPNNDDSICPNCTIL